MKKTLFIFLVITLYNISAQEWKKQNSPTSEALYDVFFIDKMKGWAVGNNGVVLRTTDSGNPWIKQESGTKEMLRSVFFVDSLNGYSVGSNGRIIKSTDGGLSWKVISGGTNHLLSKVFFLNKDLGWIVGGASITGSILKTTNSGLTWEKMIDTTAGTFRGVYFIDDKNGWVVGAGSFFDNLEPHRILRTTDGGITWQNLSDRTRPGPLVDVYFFNSNCGWAAGYSPSGRGILYTNNGGLTWSDRRIQRGELAWSDYYRKLAVVDSNNLWVATEDTIYQSIDSGNNWKANSRESANFISSIYFVDKNNGWAVGVEGSIWKYNGNIVGVHNEKIITTKNSYLEDCYPNPANPSTNIRFFISKESFVRLQIYDILGQKIATIVEEYKLPGTYTVTFDGSKLSSGVYFYSIIFDSYLKTKKLILIK